MEVNRKHQLLPAADLTDFCVWKICIFIYSSLRWLSSEIRGENEFIIPDNLEEMKATLRGKGYRH